MLIAQCADPGACAAELWRAADGTEATLLRTRAQLRWQEDTWPATWQRLGGALSMCLGDPLASPPAGDPAGFRILLARAPPAEDDAAQWILRLSGQNRCRLSGALILQARRDRVDARELLCDGVPWTAGGRDRAQAILLGE